MEPRKLTGAHTGAEASQAPLAQVWAMENGEWWPASLPPTTACPGRPGCIRQWTPLPVALDWLAVANASLDVAVPCLGHRDQVLRQQ